MNNYDFIMFSIKRTLLHFCGAAMMGGVAIFINGWKGHIVKWWFLIICWVLIAIYELFDPHDDWRWWIKSLWDLLVWIGMTLLVFHMYK